jgi:hypothetical protein
MDKPPACQPRPQQNRTKRSGHMTRYQNRTTSFAIDSLLAGQASDRGLPDTTLGHIFVPFLLIGLGLIVLSDAGSLDLLRQALVWKS